MARTATTKKTTTARKKTASAGSKASRTPASRATAAKPAPRKLSARGMTFCSLAGRDGPTLGVRTERGILDVAKASALFRVKAPTSIHEVIAGADCAPLARLVERALGDPRGRGVLVAESRAKFAPAVPNPEKILCVGLNSPRMHAASITTLWMPWAASSGQRWSTESTALPMRRCRPRAPVPRRWASAAMRSSASELSSSSMPWMRASAFCRSKAEASVDSPTMARMSARPSSCSAVIVAKRPTNSGIMPNSTRSAVSAWLSRP